MISCSGRTCLLHFSPPFFFASLFRTVFNSLSFLFYFCVSHRACLLPKFLAAFAFVHLSFFFLGFLFQPALLTSVFLPLIMARF